MNSLVVYFVLANLISWIIWFPLYGHLIGLENLPKLPYHHGIGGLGPLLSSLITTWIFLKVDGIKNLIKRCLQLKPFLYFLIALMSPFVIAISAILFQAYTNSTPIDLEGLTRSKEFPEMDLLFTFLYNVLFFGFGEEVGWRGFALPRFQTKWNALTSSLLFTFFWALWHLPLFFYRPGYIAMDISGILGWIFSLLTGSILLTWLYNSSKGSIAICAIFHSTIDIAFTSDISDSTIMNYMGIFITIWGIVTLLLFKPKNLSFLERTKFLFK